VSSANREQWSGPEAHHLRGTACRRRQAPLHGASRATRPQISCPQGHHATNHRLITWRVNKLYGVKRRRRQQRCREDCILGVMTRLEVQRLRMRRHDLCRRQAPLHRTSGETSANHMPATSSRKQSPPNKTARHGTLRRAVASASAKLPRRLCILGLTVQRRRVRRHRLCRRHTTLRGASEATRPYILRRCTSIHRLVSWHVTQLYGAQRRRRRRRCREVVHSEGCDKTRSSEKQNAPTPLMSALGGLARRFWGDASVYHMSVRSLREHWPPNIMACHRSLRRATPSAETMRERRQTAQALFLTKKKVGLFLVTAACRFSVVL